MRCRVHINCHGYSSSCAHTVSLLRPCLLIPTLPSGRECITCAGADSDALQRGASPAPNQGPLRRVSAHLLSSTHSTAGSPLRDQKRKLRTAFWDNAIFLFLIVFFCLHASLTLQCQVRLWSWRWRFDCSLSHFALFFVFSIFLERLRTVAYTIHLQILT